MNKIFIGIKNNIKKWLLGWFLGYTVLWTIIEPILAFTTLNITGLYKFLGFILLALIIATYRVYPKKEISFLLKNTGTKITIVFDDLFKLPGCKAIPVNEFFDSKIGKLVSLKSLHGIFLQTILGGHSLIFDSFVDAQCKDIPHEMIERPEGKKKQYPIGTTVVITHNSIKYLLFVAAKTDLSDKAFSNPAIMLEALAGFWTKSRCEHNGEKIVIPLVGGGLSGVGLPARSLIELILISILKATKEQELSTSITICLLPDLIKQVDLSEIQKNWR